MEIFVARQPVFDREERLAAFELLYGDTTGAADEEAGAAPASEALAARSLLGPGLDRWPKDCRHSSLSRGPS